MTLSHIILALAIVPIMAFTAVAQESVSSDLQDIESTITSYAQSGDAQDVSGLEAVTHTDFRVVFRVSDEQTVTLPREVFFGKFRDKEFGGDDRTIDIQSIDIRGGKTAIAKVVLRGEQATMSNYLNLAKVNGEWVLLSDFVFMGE